MDIKTRRLFLRRPHAGDVEAMFAIMSSAKAMRYWSTLPHASVEVTRGWLANMIERTEAGGEDFLVEFEGKVIGNVGAGRIPDFGFIIHPDYWGRGFAPEASEAFIDYAFGTLKIAELKADVDPRNAASLKVLDRLGFVETGRAERTFLLGDEWCDSIYLRLVRDGHKLTGAESG